MKFIVSSTSLQKHLQMLGGVIGTNTSLPILEYFLFDLDGNELTVTATDLETTMVSTLEVESEVGGAIAVPARLLLDTLKTFPEQPLTFVQEENNVLELSSSYGKYALSYVAADEFPKTVELAEPGFVSIPCEVLATAISKTLFAAGNDEMRPAMSGVFFQFGSEGCTFVATDAHKLVKYHRTDITAKEQVEFIMPKKPLTLLKNILDDIDGELLIEYNGNNAKFTFDKTTLICRLVEGRYPNYEAVIPKENPNKLSVNRTHFLSSVRRVSIFSNKTTHQIRLRMAGSELNISAEDVDYSNRAEERLSCDYHGEDMQIGFNSRFLLEMLNNLKSQEVLLEMSLPSRAGILTPIDELEKGESLIMLVMPVMLAR